MGIVAQLLKQSTAITIQLGPFVDSTDGVTPETGLTISQSDVMLSKNGAAYAQKNDATAATHDQNGWYRVPINATDTGTLGRLIVSVYESGALPVWREFTVVPANTYDSLVSGSDYLQTDAIQIEGSDATTQIGDATADEVYESTYTLRQLIRLMSAVQFGKTTDSGTTSPKFRDIGDTKNRISATLDGSNNRTSISLDGT